MPSEAATNTTSNASAIVFLPFVMDLRSERLMRGDEDVPLRPKTWAVLRYLAERPGALVTKDELFARLWPGLSVTDDALTKCIREIRAALGDDQRQPRFLQTVHRRGFRFVARTGGPLSTDTSDGPREDVTPSLPRYFVGRTTELDFLRVRFELACAGHRQIVFVTGESGLGKTSLVDALAAQLEPRHQVNWAVGSAVEQQGAGEAYLPFLVALERLARSAHGDQLVAFLRRFAPTWLAQIPWLAEPTATNAPLPIEIRPERMLREFCMFIEAATVELPLVLVLEDLHWSDAATIELIGTIGQRHEAARLLVVVTYRPAEVAGSKHPLSAMKRRLSQLRKCTELRLNALSAAEVRAYIGERFPGCNATDDLARMIHDFTGGSPLFMSVLLDDYITRGFLVETEPGWALTVPLVRIELDVPNDLRDMIVAQLESLHPDDRSVVEAASVAGVEFNARAIRGCVNMDGDEVDLACDRLRRSHRFFAAAGREDWGREGSVPRYAFTHALHRHVVYEGLHDGRRQRLHRSIGESMEAAYVGKAHERAAALALHFEQGRDVERAITYLCDAAKHVLRRYAAREAIAYLERALALVSRLPDVDAQRREELRLRSVLSSALSALHGYPSDAARRNYEIVRAMCDEIGDASDQYAAMYAMWHSQSARAEPAARATAEQIARLAGVIDRPDVRSHASILVGRSLFWQGCYRESDESLRHARALCNEAVSLADGSIAALEPPWIAVDWYSAVTLWCLGYADRACGHARAALTSMESLSDPYALAGGFIHTAYLFQLARNPSEVEHLAGRALHLVEEHGLVFWRSFAQVLLGRAAVQQGRAVAALTLLREGLRIHRDGGTVAMTSHILGFMAEACLQSGDFAKGLDAVREGLNLASETLDRVWEPELWRIKGELLSAQTSGRRTARHTGRRDESPETCFERALEIARARDAKAFELRAAVSLWRHQRTHGRPDAARELVAEVYGWFTEGFETPDLLEAKEVLATR